MIFSWFFCRKEFCLSLDNQISMLYNNELEQKREFCNKFNKTQSKETTGEGQIQGIATLCICHQ